MDHRLCDSVSHQTSVVASNDAVVNVPQIVGCQVTGSVNINIETHVNASVNSKQTQHEESSNTVKRNIQQLSEILKISLRKKCERIYEGLAKRGNQTLLNRIYTELYIIDGERDTVNQEHEVWQMDNAVKRQLDEEKPIHCNDIFKNLRKQSAHIRTALTKGIAGIGKTVSVQKFILDWAEGTANQDVDFMFVLPFRELNLIQDEQYSLHKLLLDFHPELSEIENEKIYDKSEIVFIFDGLDESRLCMNFDMRRRVSNVTKIAKVDDLIINLIEGNLLPSTRLWITSRPAAVHKIPAEYINRVTEIHGFTDAQKEEYFRKRISDEHQASRIISHVRRSRSLHIMCHIPVFCWITATVLEKVLETGNEQISSSLTEMYTRFLLIQINENKRKYQTGVRCTEDARKLQESDVEIVLNLGQLAFENLKKNNLVFGEEQLRTLGIDVNNPSVWSGICTQILTEEDPMFSISKYSFVHLSFQEYLAALFVFYSHVVKRVNLLQSPRKKQAARSFYDYNSDDESENEHQERSSVEKETLHDFQRCAIDAALTNTSGRLDLFLRFLLGLSHDRHQLLRCFQMTVDGVQLSIQNTIEYVKTKLREDDDRKTPPAERCINLLFCLMELGDYSLIEEIRRFHISEVQRGHKLTAAQCSSLAYIIQMSEEVLEELDLSKYNTTDHGRLRLVPAVKNCRKAILSACALTQECFEAIASALLTPNSVLEELDVSWQGLHDLSPLYRGLKSPYCILKSVNFSHTNLEKKGKDLLDAALFGPQIQTQTLKVLGCRLSDDCVDNLALALESSESRLVELDLGYNKFTSSGIERISQGLLSPSCELMKLSLSGCQVGVDSCKLLASALKDSFLIDLDLSSSRIGDDGVKWLCAGLSSPQCQLQSLRLRDCALSGTSCLYLAVALSSFSVLRHLDLSNNDLQDSGVKLISIGLQNSILRYLGLSGCMVTDEGCCYLASALSSNPSSHLRELDLSYNHPQHSGRQMLSQILNDPNCTLEILRLDHCGPLRIIRGLWKYYQELTLNSMSTHSALTTSSDNKGAIRLPVDQYLFNDYDDDYYDDEDGYEKPKKPETWVQSFCIETLSDGRFYWQVDWNGFVSIGVEFKRKTFSYMKKTLQLCCNRHQYYALHEDMSRTKSLACGNMPESRTVGVFLDCAGGTLSFYSIFPHSLTHLHTFHTEFNDPVTPYFKFSTPDLDQRPPSVVIHTLVPSSVVQTRMLMLPSIMDAFPWLTLQNIFAVF
nr:NACHT, LRR and PYD domains-containing protein 3-like [Misgurnus anguillicaudatus]XP_055060009.1 NACHT, LRR and PYD domains-containing protein 3-like [Misgurnus anguillicaudatus]